MNADSTKQFQVDLRGVVDLLSRHIYSSPRVYLRELLQNARDAVTARREIDGAGGNIRITPVSSASDEFVMYDDGVGLTADEMTELLATVGRSSKRDIFDLPRQDYLGQFGIGLLSCFMVSDEIVIRSRSAKGASAVEWIGRSDGTFTVNDTSIDMPIGTSVHLRPRHEQRELLQTPSVLALAESFAEFLPISIRVDLPGGAESTLGKQAPFIDVHADPQAAMAYGEHVLSAAPFGMIPLDVPATGTRGVAYVLPFAPPPSSARSARVYLNGMLLSERTEDLLPEWAFFVRAVVDSTGLTPTASRESLVQDEALEQTRAELGAIIRRWVLEMGLSAPHMLAQFVAIHEVPLKALVQHDEELAGFITRWLTVDTTLGRMTIGDLLTRHPRIRLAKSLDEFRQVASISDNAIPLVNGGYLYDTEIIRSLSDLYPSVVVEDADVISEFERLDPPPLDDRDTTVRLEERATKALASVDVAVIVRSLATADVPAFYVADAQVLRTIDRNRAKGAAGSLWADVLSTADTAVADITEGDEPLKARLCLNWAHPVTRAIARATDENLERTVHLLYGQALLAGHRPLTGTDRDLMTNALGSLIDLSASQGFGDEPERSQLD